VARRSHLRKREDFCAAHEATPDVFNWSLIRLTAQRLWDAARRASDVRHSLWLRRVQVTDTTTFTDEARRAEVDAWLYETCTQCLQHMVDIVVQFYPVVQPLLTRILDLLSNFIRWGAYLLIVAVLPRCSFRPQEQVRQSTSLAGLIKHFEGRGSAR